MTEYHKLRSKLMSQSEDDGQLSYELPKRLRIKIIDLLNQALGRYLFDPEPGEFRHNNPAWEETYERIEEEFNLPDLVGSSNVKEICSKLLLDENIPTSITIKIVEICFGYINAVQMQANMPFWGTPTCSAPAAIKQLNDYFGRARVGFRFENNRIIRVESGLMHTEVVSPAHELLTEAGFSNPQNELLVALDHHRHGHTEDAIVRANKAFESTMKDI